MGSSQSVFTEEEIKEYQDMTFFSKKEIIHVFNKFKKLDEEKVNANRHVRLPKSQIAELPELKFNPFTDRMCDVFSSANDGHLSFEDFLDMMSAFSESASKQVKVESAFHIYDFDNDNVISGDDLRKVIDLLTGDKHLADDEMSHLIESMLKEADMDGDGLLSFGEFQHVMSKSPDFVNSFFIRM